MVGEFREEAQMYSLQLDDGPKTFKVNYVQPSLAMFKPPMRHYDCRICNQLRKNEDTRMLFDNHISNFPSGCPRFIGMTITECVKICQDAKICFRCHDPSYVWKFSDIKSGKHKCVSKSTKSRYICKNSGCNIHMWCYIKKLKLSSI